MSIRVCRIPWPNRIVLMRFASKSYSLYSFLRSIVNRQKLTILNLDHIVPGILIFVIDADESAVLHPRT